MEQGAVACQANRPRTHWQHVKGKLAMQHRTIIQQCMANSIGSNSSMTSRERGFLNYNCWSQLHSCSSIYIHIYIPGFHYLQVFAKYAQTNRSAPWQVYANVHLQKLSEPASHSDLVVLRKTKAVPKAGAKAGGLGAGYQVLQIRTCSL